EISFLELFGKLGPGEKPDWGVLIDPTYVERCVLDPQVPFVLRIDLSATEDATGLALGRINGYRLLEESEQFNPRTGAYERTGNTRAPIFFIDGVLRIKAIRGEEIDVGLVAQLGLELNRLVNIRFATSDRAESSRAVLQTWRTHGIYCDFLSVDTDIRPYLETKNALREERLIFPPHETLDRELRQLRRILKNGESRVDHPHHPGASKDVADALAGTVFVLLAKESAYRSKISDTRVRPGGRRR
ncbi:MAG: hypothetical protein V2B18_10445, partial [Pseudomonadota bacterium]